MGIEWMAEIGMDLGAIEPAKLGPVQRTGHAFGFERAPHRRCHARHGLFEFGKRRQKHLGVRQPRIGLQHRSRANQGRQAVAFDHGIVIEARERQRSGRPGNKAQGGDEGSGKIGHGGTDRGDRGRYPLDRNGKRGIVQRPGLISSDRPLVQFAPLPRGTRRIIGIKGFEPCFEAFFGDRIGKGRRRSPEHRRLYPWRHRAIGRRAFPRLHAAADKLVARRLVQSIPESDDGIGRSRQILQRPCRRRCPTGRDVHVVRRTTGEQRMRINGQFIKMPAPPGTPAPRPQGRTVRCRWRPEAPASAASAVPVRQSAGCRQARLPPR